MKVLFLDIDGVLNHADTIDKIRINSVFDDCHGLDSVILPKFTAWLAAHPEVKVVISSSWRLHEGLLAMIREAGIDFIDITGKFGDQRQREILDWLSRHEGVTQYAILDDMQFFSGCVRRHFVQTNYETGLQNWDLRRVETILGLRETVNGLVET